MIKFQTCLQDEFTDLSDQFAIHLEDKNIKSATDVLVKMKYLASMEKKIKSKLVKFL